MYIFRANIKKYTLHLNKKYNKLQALILPIRFFKK